MQPVESATRTFDHWLASLREVCGNFDSTPGNQHDFQGSASIRPVGGLEIASIRTNAQRLSQPQCKSMTEAEHCFLIVQKQGSATMVQDGNSLNMRPGEMMLLDSAIASEILPHGLIENDSFHLPRDEVLRRFGQHQAPFMKIAADCASGQILQMIVSRLLSGQLTSVGDEKTTGISDSLISLLPAIHQHQKDAAPHLEGANDVLYRCIQQYLDHHLHESDLSPEHLAVKFHVSVRQLYRLFEQHDESVCRYVQRKRLERCAEALANPLHACQTITSIAFQWGFTDSAHFSRAFKRQFAQSPREYRRQHLIEAA